MVGVAAKDFDGTALPTKLLQGGLHLGIGEVACYIHVKRGGRTFPFRLGRLSIFAKLILNRLNGCRASCKEPGSSATLNTIEVRSLPWAGRSGGRSRESGSCWKDRPGWRALEWPVRGVPRSNAPPIAPEWGSVLARAAASAVEATSINSAWEKCAVIQRRHCPNTSGFE